MEKAEGFMVRVPKGTPVGIYFLENFDAFVTVCQTLEFRYKSRMRPQGLSGEIPGFPGERLRVLHPDIVVGNTKSESSSSFKICKGVFQFSLV